MSDLVATNVSDTIRFFPLITHGYVGPFFNDLFDKANKFFAAKHSVEELERIKTNGTLPLSLNSIKTPTLQVTSDYKSQPSTINGKYQNIDTETRSFRKKALDLFIAAKKEEKDWIHSTHLAHNALEHKRVELLEKIHVGLCVVHGVQKPEDLPDNILENIETFDNLFLTGAHHVLEIARNKTLKAYEKVRKRRKVKAAADVEMTEAGGAVNVQTIEKAVVKVMKQTEQSRRDKKKSLKEKTKKKESKSKKTSPSSGKGKGSTSKVKKSKKSRK